MEPDMIQVAVDLTRQALILTLEISLPILLIGMVVGLLVSLLQAVTQIQEQTLSFIPKITAVALTILFMMPWLLNELVDYTRSSIQEFAPLDEWQWSAIKVTPDAVASELDAEAACNYLYHDAAEGIAAAATSRLKPQPLEPLRSACIQEESDALGSLKRRVILAEEDRVISADSVIAMAERAGVPVESMPTGHCPFLSMPKMLADLLLGVA